MKKFLLPLVLLSVILMSCGDKKEPAQTGTIADQVEYSPEKDMSIQQYNLQQMKDQSSKRNPADTIELMEYVLNNYPQGTYLVTFDKTTTYNIPKAAVVYYKRNNTNYVFGVVAKSKPDDERLIETKNIVGYDQSYIDLDSTELGTAFFYLTLFEHNGESFNTVWESIIPSHGGFNDLSLKRWIDKGMEYIKVNFHYAQGIGHIDYNYFFVDGFLAPPHLLMTYEGINFQRTITNVNNDKFPDYLEYVYVRNDQKEYAAETVPFVWSPKDSLYISTKGRRFTRPY